MKSRLFFCIFWSLLCATAFADVEVREPEATASVSVKQALRADELIAVTANPYASQAAYSTLLQGGSAIDAAIAAQLVLNLVEPQSSGIGGGGFALWYQADQQQVSAWDGRETAPAHATPERFLKPDGTPMRWRDALVGGRSVGVPGLVALLEQIHLRHGKLPWASLFAPAIRLAEQGFVVSPRLAYLLAADINPGMRSFTTTADYFFPAGKPLQAGSRLKNPAFAESLRRIARQGSDGFYRGPLAQAITDTVQQAEVNPGDLSLTDLADYRVKQRTALCNPFAGYQVCGMPLPSSGGITVSQILGIWEALAVTGLIEQSPGAVHAFTQASRLAYADRNYYLADIDFVSVPVRALQNPHYLANRAQLIDMAADMGKAQPGRFEIAQQAESDALELPSTSHLVIVDSDGNAISMTSSIEMGFGSGMMVGGFLLNNQLTDFALSPKRDGRQVANRVEAGKRPLSSMSPTIVLNQQGGLQMALGSPGGSRIIDYVAQSLILTLQEQLSLQQAINSPHITNRNDYTALEVGTPLVELAPQLKTMGHKVKLIDLNSGLHGVERCGDAWCGAADPRREGVAMGR